MPNSYDLWYYLFCILNPSILFLIRMLAYGWNSTNKQTIHSTFPPPPTPKGVSLLCDPTHTHNLLIRLTGIFHTNEWHTLTLALWVSVLCIFQELWTREGLTIILGRQRRQILMILQFVFVLIMVKTNYWYLIQLLTLIRLSTNYAPIFN